MATVDPAEFVRVWQESASLAEVAARMQVTKMAAAVRACKYRKKGINLKMFTIKAKPIDSTQVTELNQVIEKGA